VSLRRPTLRRVTIVPGMYGEGDIGVDGMSWLDERRRLDSLARDESAEMVRAELSILSQVMGLGHKCLNLALAKYPVQDSATQAKVIVANHAFNLLCSAIDDALVGRYGAASDHWRTIIESPRFLTALQLNPALSEKMLKGQLKIETVLETIRSEFTLEKYPGADLKWVEDMAAEIGRIQPYSHVHLRTASAGYPIDEDDGVRTYRVGPGGLVNEAIGADNVMFLADAAIILVASMFFSFSLSHPDVAELGTPGGFATLKDLKENLLVLARGRGVEI
jgi:hypothetical protein